MDITQALTAIREYYDLNNPTEEDDFVYTEALRYFIDTTGDPRYMYDLGWFYSTKKRFDTGIRYYEMAAECGYGPAHEELGYMWYYGQHGEKDYKKAFDYFTTGSQYDRFGNKGSLWCKYKLADMYRFGCAVEKDEAKYREMIEEAYEEVKDPGYLNEPYPEICYRLAGIRAEEGKIKEAVRLLRHAKEFMAERLSENAFWGHIEVMGRIVLMLYDLTEFDKNNMDFYDLFYLSQSSGNICFKLKKKEYRITVSDDEDRAIGFESKWYRTFAEFCQKAEIDDSKFTALYDDFYDWEVA